MCYGDEPATRNDVENMISDSLSTLRNNLDEDIDSYLSTNLRLTAEKIYIPPLTLSEFGGPGTYSIKISLILKNDIISQCQVGVS